MTTRIFLYGAAAAALFLVPELTSGSFSQLLFDSAPVRGEVKNHPGLSKNEMQLISRETVHGRSASANAPKFSDMASQVNKSSNREKKLQGELFKAQAEQFMCASSKPGGFDSMLNSPGGGEEWFEVPKTKVAGLGEAKSIMKTQAIQKCQKYGQELEHAQCKIEQMVYRSTETMYYGVAIYVYPPEFKDLDC